MYADERDSDLQVVEGDLEEIEARVNAFSLERTVPVSTSSRYTPSWTL
jgi:hypothetical protein